MFPLSGGFWATERIIESPLKKEKKKKKIRIELHTNITNDDRPPFWSRIILIYDSPFLPASAILKMSNIVSLSPSLPPFLLPSLPPSSRPSARPRIVCSRFFNTHTHTHVHTHILHRAQGEEGKWPYIRFLRFCVAPAFSIHRTTLVDTLRRKKRKEKKKKNRSSIYNALCYTCFCGATE